MISPYDFYITPEEYSAAAVAGISKALLEDRIRGMGWSKQKAMTTPPRKTVRHSDELKALAKQNGVTDRQFRHRVTRLGWDPQRAASTPITSIERRREIIKHAKTFQQKYSSELLKLAEANGIKLDTFYMRVFRGWDPQRAATESKWSDQKKGQMRAEKLSKTFCSEFRRQVIQ